MEELKEPGKNIYSVCPLCKGTGADEFGFDCKDCNGIGTAVLQSEEYYYYGDQPSLANITMNRLKKTVDSAVNFAVFLIGVAGALALGWWLWTNKDFISIRDLASFWSFRDPLLLAFWASLLADMFVIYRISEDLRKSEKIKDLEYGVLPEYSFITDFSELEKAGHAHKHNISKYYYPDALAIVDDSYLMALRMGHDEVSVKHLFFNLLRNQRVLVMLFRLSIDTNVLLERLKKKLNQESNAKPMNTKRSSPALSKELHQALIGAFVDARDLGQKRVEAINLVFSGMKADPQIEEIFYDLEVDRMKTLNTLKWFIINQKQVDAYHAYRKMSQFRSASAMNRAYTAVATPILDHFGYDLTIAAKWGKLDFCVAREEEIKKAFEVIESGRTGIIFVGSPGVGKTTIINGIAQLMVEEKVPKIMRDKRLIEIDIARIIGGGTPAESEGRLLSAIDEAIRSGNIVLYFNNIDKTMGISAGTEQSLDLSDVIAGALERKNIICFATSDLKNYNSYIEGKALGNAMVKVEIAEPNDNSAFSMIASKIGFFEAKYKSYFTYNSIEEAIRLTKKFMHDKYLPSKAIDVLEMTASKAAKTAEEKVIAKADIAETVSSLTHIPVSQATADEGKLLLELENKIHQFMINQEEAVKMVAASLRRARAQMTEGKRPIANFLFMGPTGVGKTELAKTISRVYFGDERYMIRVDMSEYQHPDSVSKMIGDSAGGQGYLTEAVRRAPFSLILLDEFEKAYSEILNLFLQVMDDGRLTDGQGRTVDFTNSIIIATSNVGALFIQEQIKANRPIEEIKEELINNQLNQVLRPELVNRFDGVIVFKPLAIKEVTQIAVLMLNKLAETLEKKGIFLRYSEAGAAILAEAGYDPKFGARPLRRVIQERIEDNIANKILAGELNRRDTVVIGEDASISVEKAKEL